MTETITLVDQGRGLQLSTSRITVLDLVPYFQQGCSYEEIIRWLPTLSVDEIALVEAHYRAHQPELDERDRRARAYREEQIQLQNVRFPKPAETPEERRFRMSKLLHQRRSEMNGEGPPR